MTWRGGRIRESFGRRAIGAAFVAAIALLIGGGRALAAGPRPALEIVAPTTGTVFQSEQTIQLTVSAIPALAASRPGIAVLGDGGLGGTVLHRLSPFVARFVTPSRRKGPPLFGGLIAIPPNLKPGRYKLTAVARGPGDKLASSAPVFIQIELPPNTLLSLTPPPAPIVFAAIGEQLPIRVPANTANGGLVNLTGSQNLTLTASDQSIVTVAPNAIVTAVGPGQAAIVAALNGGGSVSVPIRVLPPALTPSATAMDFGPGTIATQGAPQSLTITNSFSYPITIFSVTSSAEFPETDNCAGRAPLAAGASCTINLAFMPLGAGNRAGAVEIANSAVIAPTRVYLSGVGNSTPGVKAHVFPQRIFFGVVTNRPRTRRVIIRNLGNATLHGYVPALMGVFAVTGGAGIFTLARGGGHVVEIVFPYGFIAGVGPFGAPIGSQHVSATLTITTDDPTQPSIPIELTGILR